MGKIKLSNSLQFKKELNCNDSCRKDPTCHLVSRRRRKTLYMLCLRSRGVLLIPTQIYYGMAFLAMPAQIRQGRQCTFITILESCSNSSESSLFLSRLWLLRTYKFLSRIFSKPYTTRWTHAKPAFKMSPTMPPHIIRY